jgi:hypothetical protein
LMNPDACEIHRFLLLPTLYWDGSKRATNYARMKGNSCPAARA